MVIEGGAWFYGARIARGLHFYGAEVTAMMAAANGNGAAAATGCTCPMVLIPRELILSLPQRLGLLPSTLPLARLACQWCFPPLVTI